MGMIEFAKAALLQAISKEMPKMLNVKVAQLGTNA